MRDVHNMQMWRATSLPVYDEHEHCLSKGEGHNQSQNVKTHEVTVKRHRTGRDGLLGWTEAK